MPTDHARLITLLRAARYGLRLGLLMTTQREWLCEEIDKELDRHDADPPEFATLETAKIRSGRDTVNITAVDHDRDDISALIGQTVRLDGRLVKVAAVEIIGRSAVWRGQPVSLLVGSVSV